MFIYTIQRGDTLYKLSDLYDVSVQEIMDANPFINPNNLFIGQPIRIPISRYLYQKYPWYYLFPTLFVRFPRNYWNNRRRWPRMQPDRDGWSWPDRENWTNRDGWAWTDRDGDGWTDRDRDGRSDRDRDGKSDRD